MKNNEGLIKHFCFAVVAKSMKHSTLEHPTAGLNLVWNFEWNM
jgi:hypothetical protein